MAVLAALAAGEQMGGGPAWAADAPAGVMLRAAGPFEWSGFYFGGHAGIGVGTATGRLSDPGILQSNKKLGSGYGGIHVGHNRLVTPNLLLGVESDISFPSSLDPDNLVWSGTTANNFVHERIDFLSTVRGRLGYVSGHWLTYATAGVAWSRSEIFRSLPGANDEQERSRVRAGWTAGGGIEFGFDAVWSARLEYLYSRLGRVDVPFGPDARYTSTLDLHSIHFGLNRKLDGNGDASSTGNAAASNESADSIWEIHGQSTFIHQGYPAFPALYSGPNSLSPGGQGKETLTASLFLGLRLWTGGELYYNPELFQGFGLSDTVGAGGFPNGEAQKSNFLFPRYSTSRVYLRQTFGFGGEQETVESDAGQLSGKRDVSRLTVQVGKFSVKDQFDSNTYASDPRVHFLNWSIWAAGAFDYPADRLGLTYGASAEFNQKDWAARTGYFLVGNQANSNNFDMAVFRRGGYVSELELRYSLFSQPGKFRAIAWFHNTFSGSYCEAVELVLMNPGLDATDAIISTRKGRTKFGYVFNVEQSITEDLGLFARWSWNNGKNEISAFTDIDASLSGGASLKGTAWGRPNDTVGIGGAINALSKDHRDYIAAGGLGVLIGDGKLNYREEKIAEAYYAVSLGNNRTFTADYQFLLNPAYNADRGPVHVFAGRWHAEF